MKLVLLGPPGAGKGTQAARLIKDAELMHLSTGDMLRQAVKDGTETGIKAKSYMDSGALVPDGVVIGIIEDRLKTDGPTVSHLFDGFPRTVPQAEALEEMLARIGSNLDKVVYFDVPEDVVVERLSGRRTCRQCGANYHVKFVPPKVEGKCDKSGCDGELYQREDDKPESVINRLDAYIAQTSSLIDFYEKKGVLCKIEAAKEPEAIYKDVKAALGM